MNINEKETAKKELQKILKIAEDNGMQAGTGIHGEQLAGFMLFAGTDTDRDTDWDNAEITTTEMDLFNTADTDAETEKAEHIYVMLETMLDKNGKYVEAVESNFVKKTSPDYCVWANDRGGIHPYNTFIWYIKNL